MIPLEISSKRDLLSNHCSPPDYAPDSIASDIIPKHNEFLREVDLMNHLPWHPNICKFIGYCDISDGDMFLCYEYLPGGSLHGLIMDSSQTYNVLKIASDIASGMAFLHHHGIMHRDLKSSNVMLDTSNDAETDSDQPLTAKQKLWHGKSKLSDFGLSCLLYAGRDMTSETGTYRWMAPEIIRHETYSFPADVYSFGILLWELIAREHPFATLTPIQAAFSVAKHDLRPTIPSDVHPRLKAIITRCWHPVPLARPSFDEIVDLLGQV